ncbi:MAG: hypothetical protein ACMUIA_04690, partial [bacterium]
LSREKFFSFRRRFSGAVLSALVLGQRDKETGIPIALTENYMKVLIPGADDCVNQQVAVEIVDVCEGKTQGRIV